jgi:hypothetical protein
MKPMKRFSAFLIICISILCLSAGAAMAKWSLLEDYQMADLAGDRGLCFAALHDKCAFEITDYATTYPDDDLKDDMDGARERGYDMIFYDFSFKHPMDPPPGPVAVETPVSGEPFFQSSWYTPDYNGWVNLWKKFLETLPDPLPSNP